MHLFVVQGSKFENTNNIRVGHPVFSSFTARIRLILKDAANN